MAGESREMSTSIEKLLEQQQELDKARKEIAAKVRAAKAAQARKKAAHDAKLYTVLGEQAVKQHGGDSKDIAERIAHAAQSLGIEMPVRKPRAPKTEAAPARAIEDQGAQQQQHSMHHSAQPHADGAGAWQQNQH